MSSFAADLSGLCLAVSLTLFLASRKSTFRATSPCETPGPAPLVIVSCDELIAAGKEGSTSYGLAGADEHVLYAALRARGVNFHVRSWSDASVDWRAYSVVLCRTAWDYSESEARAYAFTKWLGATARTCRVLNDARVMAWNIHKSYLAELVDVSRGLPRAPGALELATIPSEFVPAGARVDLAALLARVGWTVIDIIFKPCVGGGSRACHVMRVGDSDALARAQAFIDAHVLGDGGVVGDARVAHAALVAGSHAAAAHVHAIAHGSPPTSAIASTLSYSVTPAAAHSSLAARALGANAAAAEGSDFTAWSLTAAVAPCDMLIQPFFESVSEGELSVIFINSQFSHAVRKRPRAGEFRCQEEYGGVASLTTLPPSVLALAERALAAARIAVSTRMPDLDAPSSPGAATLERNTLLPPLPAGSIFVSRFDFLPANPDLIKRAWPKSGNAPHPSTPWLLLEAELIEPALFFKEAASGGVDAAGALAEALERELAAAVA